MDEQEQLLTTARKNQVSSYGLTLVAGLPLPLEFFNQIQNIQQQLEDTAPNHFTWYQRDHSHLTLYAPLRSRKREYPPLGQQELPSDLEIFIAALDNCLAQLPPFSIELTEVQLTPVGHVVIHVKGATAVKKSLIETLTPFIGTESPKSNPDKVHGTIGYLHKLPTELEKIRLQEELQPINQKPVGHMVVEQIWLVHYAHRTLTRVVGKMPFALGQSNSFATQELLSALGIG